MSSGRILRFPSPRDRRGRNRAKKGVSQSPPRLKGPVRKLLSLLLILALLALLVLVAGQMEDAGTFQTSGSAVINDGDTITLGGERVRLQGIDAPELSQTCGRNGAEYDCGRAAHEALKSLIAGRMVTCSGRKRDRYDRLLADCSAGGFDLNRGMVDNGWALAYGRHGDVERAASARGAGLWAGSFERPQDWRARHGAMGEYEQIAELGADWRGAIGEMVAQMVDFAGESLTRLVQWLKE